MREPTLSPLERDCPTPGSKETGIDPIFLQSLALRYAAGELTSCDSEAFEARLATDQAARDALSEAVRLSAAALGQPSPAPTTCLRATIRERLLGWSPAWLARRYYRGHPMVWAGVGALVVAFCTIIGLTQNNFEPAEALSPVMSVPTTPAQTATVDPANQAPEPRPHHTEEMATTVNPDHSIKSQGSCDDEHGCKSSVAEIWAELSTPDHVEKMHEEELRWRHKLRDIGAVHPGRPMPAAAINDSREP
jgi:hypothetical protein